MHTAPDLKTSPEVTWDEQHFPCTSLFVLELGAGIGQTETDAHGMH